MAGGRSCFFSLFGTAFDDLVMALAPTLSLLYLGRTLAGNHRCQPHRGKCLSWPTPPSRRTRAAAFGRMNAFFGIGFIAGACPRRPRRYLLAAGTLLPRSSAKWPQRCDLLFRSAGIATCIQPALKSSTDQSRPTQSIRGAAVISSLHGVSRLLYIFCTMEMVGQVPAVLWVIIYGVTNFRWSSATVGLSFALFGLLHAVCPGISSSTGGEASGAARDGNPWHGIG